MSRRGSRRRLERPGTRPRARFLKVTISSRRPCGSRRPTSPRPSWCRSSRTWRIEPRNRTSPPGFRGSRTLSTSWPCSTRPSSDLRRGERCGWPGQARPWSVVRGQARPWNGSGRVACEEQFASGEARSRGTLRKKTRPTSTAFLYEALRMPTSTRASVLRASGADQHPRLCPSRFECRPAPALLSFALRVPTSTRAGQT